MQKYNIITNGLWQNDFFLIPSVLPDYYIIDTQRIPLVNENYLYNFHNHFITSDHTVITNEFITQTIGTSFEPTEEEMIQQLDELSRDDV